MVHARQTDEKLFRLACGTLVIAAIVAVLGVILVVVRLAAAKDQAPKTGHVVVSSQEIALFLNQPALVAVPTGAVPLQQSPFTITGDVGRGEMLSYEVQQGETLHDLAERFGLDFCTLLWSNPPNLLGRMDTGTQITILPKDGLWLTIETSVTVTALAQQTQVDVTQILFNEFNPFLFTATPDTQLEIGQQIFIPNGRRDDCISWQRPAWLANNDGHPLYIGCDYTNPFQGYPTNAPMKDDFRYVRGLSAAHAGVDLEIEEGTPVYAAGDGVVRYAGWHPGGLGNTIVIDHGGSHTIYGHLRVIHVSCGQPVKARQLIGGVGNTGNSTAPHLHFEVRNASFTPENPMIFVNKGF